jgi:hypothetical protein
VSEISIVSWTGPESFQPHAGKQAHFRGTGHTLKLDRVEVQPGPVPAGCRFSPFIVIFQGPQTADYLRAGIYDCEIEDGPVFNIHVSPMQSETPGVFEYQAIFS